MKYIIGILIGFALNLELVLVSMNILMMLILPTHEQGMCYHLFVSSSISFFSVLKFSKYKSFTSLVRFIPRYFILFEAVVNGILFLKVGGGEIEQKEKRTHGRRQQYGDYREKV